MRKCTPVLHQEKVVFFGSDVRLRCRKIILLLSKVPRKQSIAFFDIICYYWNIGSTGECWGVIGKQ